MKKIVLTKGVKNWAIVIPKDAVIVEKTAAEELRTYLGKALGLKLCIVSEGEETEHNFFVGATEYADKAGVSGKSKENWIIKMVGGNLILTGGEKRGDRGAIYSVYHFLEDILGVRWWSPYEEDVPSLPELSLDENLYMEGNPAIAHRKAYMHSGAGLEGVPHMARTRTNVISPLDDKIENGVYNPEVRKYGDFQHAGRPHHAHTATKYFPKDEYFDKHPDWWAWNKVEGKHIKTGGLCLSNPDLRKAFLEKLMGFIEEDIKLSEETGVEFPCYYSLSQDDLDEYCACQCEECTKTIEKTGYSGYLIQFVNWIAREVAKKYPQVKIEYLAYLNFIDPPKDDTVPDSNVITRMANLTADIMHGITSKPNERYLALLRAWSDIAKKSGSGLFVWDYMYNNKLNYPSPLFYRIHDTVKAFHEYGVSGVFIETQNGFADMWLLNNYIMTHCLENPDVSEDALVEDFMMRYYGPAGEIMKQYVELLRRTSEKYLIRTYCVRECSPFNYIDYETAIEGSALLSKAAEVAAGKLPYSVRVNWAREPMDVTILLKYFDLKRMAESAGVEFDFDRRVLKERICAAIREQMELPMNAMRRGGFAVDLNFFENYPIRDERKFDIPEELKNENPKDIYQFHMNDMIQFIQPYVINAFGQSFVSDPEAACGEATRLCADTATGYNALQTMRPTSKNAVPGRAVNFTIKKNDDTETPLRFYKEDCIPGGYHLYKVGSVSGISEKNDVRAGIFAEGAIQINISGIAVNFPMDACDIYFSLKFEGELYGGDASDENAIYFDRMIVVRKN